jgi:dipeptidyl aminopeptidase/acylaminoacyl peptidase
VSEAELLNREPFTPHPFAEIQEGVFPITIDESAYQGWIRKFERFEGIEAEKLSYLSNGIKVTGYYLRPQKIPEGGAPLILFNRGGRARYGMLNVLTFNNLILPLVERGYIVAATQYRGVDGGQGEDSFGGEEVTDIINLAHIVQQFPEWDGRNCFQFGWSRGGMMTLLALKHSFKTTAAALGAPLIDLTLSTEDNQKREAWLQRVLPDYEEQGIKALEERSAPYWLNKLNKTPLLLMHGDADKDVSIMHSRRLAAQLSQREHSHKLVEYEGGNHYLNRQREEVMEEVDRWFKRHLQS